MVKCRIYPYGMLAPPAVALDGAYSGTPGECSYLLISSTSEVSRCAGCHLPL